MNVKLVQDPIFNSEYLSFALDGSFVSKNSQGGMSDASSHGKMPIMVDSKFAKRTSEEEGS